MLRLALLSAAVMIVAGCATAPPAPATDPAQVADANANERKQICVRERHVGSDIPSTFCHYEEVGVQRAMDLDAFQRQMQLTTRPVVPGSGQ